MPAELNEKRTSYTAHNWQVIGRVKPTVTMAAGERRRLVDPARYPRARRRADVDVRRTRRARCASRSSARSKPLLLTLFGASARAAADRLRQRRESAHRANGIAAGRDCGASRAWRGTRASRATAVDRSVGACGRSDASADSLFAFGGMRAAPRAAADRRSRASSELSIDARVLGVRDRDLGGERRSCSACWRRGVVRGGDLRAALAQSQRTQGGGGASYRIRAIARGASGRDDGRAAHRRRLARRAASCD